MVPQLNPDNPFSEFVAGFKQHSKSIRGLASDQQFATLFTNFHNQPVGSAERELAFQNLKKTLISKTHSQLDARTTIVDKSGLIIVDDIDDHAEVNCASCHNIANDTDVILSRLRSIGVSLNNKKPIVTVALERPKAESNKKIIQSLEKTIRFNIKKRWLISEESNLYAKFISSLPPGHPTLPVQKNICFTREMDKNIAGESFLIKTFIKLPRGLYIHIKY